MFNFVGRRTTWYSISGILIIASIISLAVWGLNPGIDFAGGTLMEIKFSDPAVTQSDISEILIPIGEESALVETDDPNYIPVSFDNAVIQPAGDNFIIRSLFIDETTHATILTKFQEQLGDFDELRFQTIGPTIGASMKEKAVWAVGMAIVFIIIFVAYAFRKVPAAISPWKFGVSAVAALIHDVVITCGVFALFGWLWNIEIDLLFITALLTIMGFSVHDTIVVFDRLRENLARSKGGKTIAVAANEALNETLARSINTSLTTLITLTFLLVLGGESIRWFIAAMVVGIIAGTYSSIFFATPLLVSWSKRK